MNTLHTGKKTLLCYLELAGNFRSVFQETLLFIIIPLGATRWLGDGFVDDRLAVRACTGTAFMPDDQVKDGDAGDDHRYDRD